MKNQKLFLLLVTVVFLSQAGCYSIRTIPGTRNSELVGKGLIVHASDTIVHLNYSGSTEEYITGYPISGVVNPRDRKSIHLYLLPGYKISLNGDKVSIPFSSVSKIEKYKINGLTTTVVVAGAAFLASIAIGVLSIILGGGYSL